MTNAPKKHSKFKKRTDEENLRWLMTIKKLDDLITDETTRELFYSLVEMDLAFHTMDCRRAFHAGYIKGLKESQANQTKEP